MNKYLVYYYMENTIFNRLKTLSNVEIIQELLYISERFFKHKDKRLFCVMFLQLKILLDTKLVRYRIRNELCDYTKVFGMVHTSNGCDFRELFYDHDGKIQSESVKKLIQNIKHIGDFFVQHYGKIRHLMTDIDDTLYPNRSSIHSLFGQDKKGQNKVPYYGVSSFMNTFKNQNKVCISLNHKSYIIRNYITVLTATPTIYKKNRMNDRLLNNILGSNFSFLQGAQTYNQIFDSISILDRTTNNKYIGNMKYNRFSEYSSLFPEYNYVFLGDNGQGDVITGKKMINKDNDTYVFIHNIQTNDGLKANEKEIHKIITPRFHFFSNYTCLKHTFCKMGFMNVDNKNFNTRKKHRHFRNKTQKK